MAGPPAGKQWDQVYQQTGYVGSSVLFHNGDAKHALQSLPPDQLNDALAITFCTDLPREDVDQACGLVVLFGLINRCVRNYFGNKTCIFEFVGTCMCRCVANDMVKSCLIVCPAL